MLISESKTTVKKSKFIAGLFEVSTADDVETEIAGFLSKHKKARHICVGILIEDFEKFKNDQEVGQPGKTLLEILKENKLNSHALVVARYFGGIKLGQGGVGRAFRDIGRKCVKDI